MTGGQVFVTGMLRSGTTLAQTLMTNHPDMLVAYQPFHQFYVDVKRLFLERHAIVRPLPLDDGDPARRPEQDRFLAWLGEHRFDAAQAAELASRATTGKGGGLPGFADLPATGGTFFDLWRSWHAVLAARLADGRAALAGSKEVLCEEYVPALRAAGIRCVLVVRDPRGAIASANNGAYRAMVGDRYPLMMLIRAWRKSAAYWLRLKDDPGVLALRYEDLVESPDETLASLASWLGVAPFPENIAQGPFRDHWGRPWSGNSSFGSKPGVDRTAARGWERLLGEREQHFIAACTHLELARLGYPVQRAPREADIADFREDTRGVRTAYLADHPVDNDARRYELERLASALRGGGGGDHGRFFLFPPATGQADPR